MKQRKKEMNFRFDEREDRNKGDMTVKRDKNLLNRIYELFMNSVCDPLIDVGLTSRELNRCNTFIESLSLLRSHWSFA